MSKSLIVASLVLAASMTLVACKPAESGNTTAPAATASTAPAASGTSSTENTGTKQ